MKKVIAIHLPTNKIVNGHLVENKEDLEATLGLVHPLIFAGIERFINAGEPVFINEAGGYCNVKGTYQIC